MINTEDTAKAIIPIRIERLLKKWQPTGTERTWYPTGSNERLVFLWQYFKDSEEEPIALRRANGLKHILQKIAIAIHDDELIVGEVGLEDFTHRDELSVAKSYWHEQRNKLASVLDIYGADQQAASSGLSHKWNSRDGHAIPAFDMILSSGLNGLKKEARKAAASYPQDAQDYKARQEQWQAMIISLEALSDYIRRYAELARQMVYKEISIRRNRELTEIEKICKWVSKKPPRTFREALQLVWFVHLGIKMDDGGVGHSFGRFDQYLYPFFKNDMETGQLTIDQARELLASFWLKLNKESDDIAHLSLGGQTPAGDDATNELSFLCLQVDRWISRKQPNLSTRIHPGTPDDYWYEVAKTIRRGAGHPAIFNDNVIIPGMIDYGLPEEIVRDYAQVGCVETFLPGLGAPWTDCYLNLAKCLELALNNGCDMLNGQKLGLETGNPMNFGSFDALFSAYEAQVKHALYEMLKAKDKYDAIVSQYEPEPLNSAFIRDCLQKGLDASGGGARYLLTGAYGVGLGTTIDSLAAIKNLVYDEKRIKFHQLLNALKANFQGHEGIKSLCQNAPKYGNDDDRADDLAVKIIESFGHQMRNYQSSSPDALHYGMLGSVLSHTSMGEKTAASANGRLAGETLSDGGSPSHGCNRKGATATLRSLSKGDHRLVPGGAAINLRLSPQYLQGDDGLEKLVSLLKTYINMGGEQLQFNVVDADTLRKALENPTEYRDLVVRVAGFTAYFVTLTPAIQQEIIARMEERI